MARQAIGVSFMANRVLFMATLALLAGCGEPSSEAEREIAEAEREAFKTFSCPEGYIKVFATPYLDCLPKD
ncbi:hypothetical protein [Phycobacter sp. K97]|uniref:hypothetical protein n=1 Tax=Phycobacter sedimenti TaxID=3133977 RepID=UPI00311FCA67